MYDRIIVMKKIIWISSYPKSGNTWMRFLVSNYFFNKEKKFNFDIANNILMFPQKNMIKNIIDKKSVINNPYEISKYWIQAQEKIEIENGNVVFLQNHNALVSINGNEFTNENLTLGSIYIVRDPRDVAISYAHYKNKSFDEIIDNLCDNNLFYTLNKKDNFPYVEILGSWKFNYISWRNGVPNIPRIIIKYEDLIKNCYGSFYKVIYFLSDLLNFDLDEKQIKFSVENSQFDKLQKSEKIYGFKANEGNTNFFRSGKSEQWKNVLNNSQIKKIESTFRDEMKFLGYL